jgi:DNA-binding transcriptional LysR family regulator
MDLLTALRVFERAAVTGSLSRVAAQMGLSQPAASRHVSMLEERFGVALLHRSPRGVVATEAGRALLEHARTIIEAVGQAEAALEGGRAIAGRVRVGVSVAFGHFLLDHLAPLLAAHPGLHVELVMRDGFGSMVEENIDVAVRPGEVTDSSLIRRLAARNGRMVVGSPAYVATRGAPLHPEDLAAHDCLAFTGDGGEEQWRFVGPGGMTVAPIRSRVRLNSRHAIRQAALGGLGLALLQEYLVVDDVAQGRLLRLLPDHPPEPLPVQIVYPARRTLTRSTSVVIDWLISVLGETVAPEKRSN